MTEHKPMEIVQIDAAPLDIFLVEKGGRKKRPWHVQVIDIRSGERLGYFAWRKPSRHVFKKVLSRLLGSD